MMQLINDPFRSTLNVRSLICDNNGIIIAETVYRCMFCAKIVDTMDQIQLHYHCEHYEEEIPLKEVNNQRQKRKKTRKIIDYDQDDYDYPVEKIFDDVVDDTIVNQDFNQIEDYFEDNSHLMSIQFHENHDADESFVSSLTQSAKSSPIQSSMPNQNPKGGTVTCEVCGLTKYYSHISRRYGVFSCESCAKFFYRYSQKPVQYKCLYNGNCSLKIDSPGARCKSCLLNACLKKYILDPKKHANIYHKHFNTDASEILMMDDINNNNPITSEDQIHMDETLNTGASLNESIVPKSIKTNQEIKHSRTTDSGVKKSKSKLNLSKKKSNSSSKDDNSPGMNSKFRRMACRVCEGCLQDDCGTCLYCLDKPKFGGNDIKKQKCLKRRCLFLKQ
uniref:Uncharacterized protein LOC113791944 n=1 Tax=Dermatophagoides pteronyssinus TaxID=6956 RepID=A0A6P6XW21_DERPT|nr:uncharacterized protein LOC113791944 [Dermatophagoides pteronyssinus]